MDYSALTKQDKKDIFEVANSTHLQRMQWRNEEVEETERQLEEIKEGKGYISQEEHEYELNKVKQEQQQIIREKSDTIGKLRNLEVGLRAKLSSSDETFRAMKLYYEDIVNKLTNDES